MSNFGFFDFLSFLLPGGLLYSFIYMVSDLFRLNIPLPEPKANLTDIYGLILGVTISYFLGHILRLATKYFIKPRKNFIDILSEKEQLMQQHLAMLCEKWFGFTFYDKTADNVSVISKEKTEKFFSRAFNTLDVDDSLSKGRILQSQLLFFYNLAMAFLAAAFFQVLVLFYLLMFRCLTNNAFIESIGIIGASFLLFVLSYHVGNKRRVLFFNAVADLFVGKDDLIEREKK